jgi:DNA-directed RNA polymerase subunit E'/Rpb7
MFLPVRFKTHIELAPSDLTDDFNIIIKDKLQSKLEGICTRYGYIKPNSIEIIRRSSGKFIKQHFNGYIHFDLLCVAEVCNPAKGFIVEAQVKNKNTLGLLAEGYMVVNSEKIPILDIIVPKKAAGILSEINIDEVEIGDVVNVMIMGKRFQMNDNKISIIGRVVREKIVSKDEPLESGDEAELEGEIDDDVVSDLDSLDDNESKDNDSGDEGVQKPVSAAKTKMVMIDDELVGADDDDDFEEDLSDEDGDDGDDGDEIEGGDIYYDD